MATNWQSCRVVFCAEPNQMMIFFINAIIISSCLLQNHVHGFGIPMAFASSISDELVVACPTRRGLLCNSAATQFGKGKPRICNVEEASDKSKQRSVTKDPAGKRESSAQVLVPWFVSFAKIFTDLPNPLVASIAITLSFPWVPSAPTKHTSLPSERTKVVHVNRRVAAKVKRNQID